MIKNLSASEKKVLLFWGVLGFVLLIIVAFINLNKDTLNKTDYTNNKYSILKDYNRYYTVSSAIAKFYSFMNSGNYQSVLNILSSNYKEENNIDIDNLKDYITLYDTAVNYQTGIVCYKDIDKGVTSYIVNGQVVKMNNSSFIKEEYLQVTLNGNNFLFSIEPINKETYEENCNG